MKDAELISRLKEVLIPDNWGDVGEDRLRNIQQGITAIIVDLEANPPLAEVEGRLIEQETIWVLLPLGLQPSDFTTVPDGNCDVTVTIRKSDVQAR